MLADRRQRHAIQRAVRRERHQLLQRRRVEHLRLRVLARRGQQRAVRRLHQRRDFGAVRLDGLRNRAGFRVQHAQVAVRAAGGEREGEERYARMISRSFERQSAEKTLMGAGQTLVKTVSLPSRFSTPFEMSNM